MLLTLTAIASSALSDARDLGFLLHKNPASVLEKPLNFGTARVFWPEAAPERATCALSVEIDPVGLVRGRADSLFAYVSDRPYAASSFLSVALSQCFSSALGGRMKEKAELATTPLSLSATLYALPCDGGESLIRRMLEPLGWQVVVERLPLDPAFPEWGAGSHYTVTLSGEKTVHDLLSHLYVLVPVLDNAKHYGIGEDEVEKLLRHGEGWLVSHPERELISRRYLRYRWTLTQSALERLSEMDDSEPVTAEDPSEEAAEAPVRLNDRRIEAAVEAVRTVSPPAATVLDLGCGEGRTLRAIRAAFPTVNLIGMDVSSGELTKAARRLKSDRDSRLQLLHGSLVYLDERLPVGVDVALLMEVIEHLDPWRLATLEEVVFAALKPHRVLVTTPNAEYNALWPSLPAGKFRHHDHRFEWTRAEFAGWAQSVAERHGYTVAFHPVGDEDATYGTPTQSVIFDKASRIPLLPPPTSGEGVGEAGGRGNSR
ncbi:MAG: 3' terminal RNA ribose 2'-O-methyltransferase Hen1 [Armatimonas sp.]